MDTNITIGEALEASVMVAGDEAMEQSDAAAIQATEARATGLNGNLPAGVAAERQLAADDNECILSERIRLVLLMFLRYFFHLYI